jgi:peptide/nickel transport system permease protein
MVRFLKHFFKELFGMLFLVVGVTAILYLIFNLMPGDFPGKGRGFEGYVNLLRRLFTFRFGTSIVSGRDINSIVFPAFRNTLILTIGSIFLSVMVSVPIGIFSAYRGFETYSWPLVILTYVLSSIPVFYLGYLSLYLVSRYTGYLPIFYPHGAERGNPVLSYVLPILVLGFGNESISEIVRLIANELRRVMHTNYVTASKARGEAVLRSSFHEGLLIPLVSIIFAKVPFIIGGAVIVEYVFNWPGMGRLAFQSALDRDLPVLIVITFLSVICVRSGMLIKEMLLLSIDPERRA